MPKKKVRSEDLLRTAERFRTIFEHAPIMIDSLDADGNWILWNRACVKYLGWTLDEMRRSDDAMALVYPNRAERDAALKAISHADGVFREYHPVAKDGTVRIQLWADFKLPDGTRISLGHDITDRKQSERALEESEQKYRSIFDLATNGIVLVDGETGGIVECNPEFERQAGRSLDVLRGMRIWELRPPAEVETAKAICKRIARDGDGGSDMTHFLQPDGTKVPIDFRSNIITIGSRRFVQSITVDMTRRRKAADELRERDERLRLFYAQVPAVLWTTDDELRVTSCTGAALENLGVTPEELVGTTLHDHFKQGEGEIEPISPHQRVLQGESVTYEGRWKGAVFEAHVEPLRDDHGRTIGCVGIALDVTERVHAEEKLRLSEQKLRALASRLQNVREEEAAIIAREIHDELGQTLTGLKMDVSWLQRRMAEMPDGKTCLQIRDRLAAMAGEVDETIHTVRRISTKLRPVILDDLGLLGALEWQGGEFEGRTGIRCRWKIETDRGQLDDERSTAVFRIFQEILTNVARHAAATEVAIALRDENGHFVLDVLDNGKGISDDELKSTRALGILGMQERAQVCGGNVRIRHEDGRGTRVVVKVPVD